MTKLSRKKIDPENLGLYINNLWSAFTLMDSKEDVRLLFKDLFTHTEYKMFAKRLEIARRLMSGEKYKDIENDLKVTPTTITRISNLLQDQGVGLKKAHEKLSQLEHKTIGGGLFKAGLKKDRVTISHKLKQKTAKKKLEL